MGGVGGWGLEFYVLESFVLTGSLGACLNMTLFVSVCVFSPRQKERTERKMSQEIVRETVIETYTTTCI